MRKVYICSKFAGNVKENIKEAGKFSRFAYRMNCLPICVHLFLNEATGLTEENKQREKILNLGLEYLKLCNELWVLIDDKISEGMKLEIVTAKKLGIKIFYFEKNNIKLKDQLTFKEDYCMKNEEYKI